MAPITAASLCAKYNSVAGACCYPSEEEARLAMVFAMCNGGGGGGPLVPEFDKEFLTGYVQDENGTIHYYYREYDEETGVTGPIQYFTGPDRATASVPVGTTKPVSTEDNAQPIAGAGQVIAITDAGVGSLVVPANATGAIIQVQQTSGPANAAIRFFDDGRVPTQTLGNKVLDLEQIVLGKVGTLGNATVLELTQFQAIAEAGATFDLVVTYYR